ncbi:hypothetical protein EC991_011089 [Linnemannia zychae]|nr:hypothetical protein EC991_011089 [Linnemannia zychae]
MLQFIKAMPEGLQELTMMVHSDYFDRVMPTLLEKSGPTLEALRLEELERASRPSTESQGSPVGLQDLLRTEWVCSKLEVLSLGIMELTAEEFEHNDRDARWKGGDDTEGGEQYPLLQGMSTADAAQHTLYTRMVDNVMEFHRRLNALPNLTSLALTWDNLCQDIPYDPFEYEIDFSKTLQWMGLKWSVVRDHRMSCVRLAMQRLLDKKKDMVFGRKMVDMGINATEIERRGFSDWRLRSNFNPKWSWNYDPYYVYMWDIEEGKEPLFEEMPRVYKSRGRRQQHFDIYRQKK